MKRVFVWILFVLALVFTALVTCAWIFDGPPPDVFSALLCHGTVVILWGSWIYWSRDLRGS